MSESAELVFSFPNSTCTINNINSHGTLNILSLQQPESLVFLSLDDSVQFPLVSGRTTISQQSPNSFQLRNDTDIVAIQLSPEFSETFLDFIHSIIGPPLQSSLALVSSDGTVLGVIDSKNQFVEDSSLLSPPSYDLVPAKPVVIEYNPSQPQQKVSLADSAGSFIVNSSTLIAAGIVYGTQLLTKGLKSGSEYIVKNSAPAQTPVAISQSTKQNVEKIHGYSAKAVQVSHATVRSVLAMANKAGAKLTKSLGYDNPDKREKSGTWKIISSVATAVDKIGDSIDTSIKSIAGESKTATASVVGHKYGPEAQELANTGMGILENATLVYIDAQGVSRKAILKTIGKSAIKYRLQDGREVTMQPQNDGSVTITSVSDSVAPAAFNTPSASK